MTILRKVRMTLVALFVVAGLLSVAAPAEAGPYWTGCRPHVDPETLEISTLCY